MESSFSMLGLGPESLHPHQNHSPGIDRFRCRFLLFLYLCWLLVVQAIRRSKYHVYNIILVGLQSFYYILYQTIIKQYQNITSGFVKVSAFPMTGTRLTLYWSRFINSRSICRNPCPYGGMKYRQQWTLVSTMFLRLRPNEIKNNDYFLGQIRI